MISVTMAQNSACLKLGEAIVLLNLRFAKQSGGFEQQDQDEQAERHHIFVFTTEVAGSHAFRHTQNQAVEHGARNAAMPPSTAAVKAFRPAIKPNSGSTEP